MPRPRKRKRICCLPAVTAFGPADASGAGSVELALEEYETVRLIDHEGLDQAACSKVMGVARSTVQRLYNDARRKIADCIVGGKTLVISGGDYTLCSSPCHTPVCARCARHGARHGNV